MPSLGRQVLAVGGGIVLGLASYLGVSMMIAYGLEGKPASELMGIVHGASVLASCAVGAFMCRRAMMRHTLGLGDLGGRLSFGKLISASTACTMAFLAYLGVHFYGIKSSYAFAHSFIFRDGIAILLSMAWCYLGMKAA